jgi:hypothetical protein
MPVEAHACGEFGQVFVLNKAEESGWKLNCMVAARSFIGMSHKWAYGVHAYGMAYKIIFIHGGGHLGTKYDACSCS